MVWKYFGFKESIMESLLNRTRRREKKYFVEFVEV